MTPCEEKVPWVLMRVHNQLLGVRATQVREMIEGTLPTEGRDGASAGRRGLERAGLPSIDLRRRLGLASAEQDRTMLVTGLAEQERLHEEWFGQLLSAAREGIWNWPETRLRACPLSAWLARSRAHPMGRAARLGALVAPHYALHALAEEARREAEGESAAQAATLLREGRDRELGEFRRALGEARGHLQCGPPGTTVVLAVGDQLLAVTVDRVESIEQLTPGPWTGPDGSLKVGSLLTAAVGRRTRDGAPVLGLDLEALLAREPLEGADSRLETCPAPCSEA